jgi:hypothetical protein
MHRLYLETGEIRIGEALMKREKLFLRKFFDAASLLCGHFQLSISTARPPKVTTGAELI